MTIRDFLEARLAEDESVAAAALVAQTPAGLEGPAPAQVWRSRYHMVIQRREDRQPYPDYRHRRDVADCGGLFGIDVAVHIARHDPARVLRDVEAKRRILALHKLNVQRIVTSPYDPFTGLHRDRDYEVQCFVCGWVTDDPTSGCETLRLLALPFAGHPDYQEAWRP